MKTYVKFITFVFLKSFFYVTFVMLSLVFILNILSELDFFKDIDVNISFILLLSLLNSPSMLLEMFPFVFLISTQLFFIKLFANNQLEIFKYSGLKNTSILKIISSVAFLMGILIVMLIYNVSANLKNFYLENKSRYANDGKYLAVITKNGLWIKDEIDNKTYIINSSKIENNFLINNFITEFNDNFKVLRNIQSNKIDIIENKWKIFDATIYVNNDYEIEPELELITNFDYKRIQTLYSDLSSLNILQLFELKDNYKKLNYSLTEVNLQLLKLLTYPFYLLLVTMFSALIMFKIKRLNTTTIQISFGLFLSVIVYYINNFFLVMGSTERITLILAILIPLITLSLLNSVMALKINEK